MGKAIRAVAVAAVLSLLPGGAGAFVVDANYREGGGASTGPDVYSYSIDDSFLNRFGADPAHRADAAWKVQHLNLYVDFRHAQSDPQAARMRIFFGRLDGPGGDAGEANVGCRDDRIFISGPYTGYSCYIVVDDQEDWGSLDVVPLLIHEFGHWVGLNHSGDQPSTDPRPPIMQRPYPPRRDITQDDAGGLHAARLRWPILSANDSFEFDGPTRIAQGVGGASYNPSPFWGFQFRRPQGGSATRYCNDWTGAWHGDCFVEFNGPGSPSLYQDIFNRSWLRADLRGRVYVRNRDSSRNAQVTVAVWGAGGLMASFVCRDLPPFQESSPGANWIRCYTPSFNSGGSDFLRIEVYNNSGWNIDVDALILGPCTDCTLRSGSGGGSCQSVVPPLISDRSLVADTGAQGEEMLLAQPAAGASPGQATAQSGAGSGGLPSPTIAAC